MCWVVDGYLIRRPAKLFFSLGNGKSSKEPPQKRRRFHGYKEDPFIFFEDDDEAYKEVKEYFKLKEVPIPLDFVSVGLIRLSSYLFPSQRQTLGDRALVVIWSSATDESWIRILVPPFFSQQPSERPLSCCVEPL